MLADYPPILLRAAFEWLAETQGVAAFSIEDNGGTIGFAIAHRNGRSATGSYRPATVGESGVDWDARNFRTTLENSLAILLSGLTATADLKEGAPLRAYGFEIGPMPSGTQASADGLAGRDIARGEMVMFDQVQGRYV